MRRLFLLLPILLIFSCKDDRVCCSSTFIDILTVFYAQNEQGDDLFDPNNPNYIDINKLRVYDLVNGEEVERYNPGADIPRGFKTYPPGGSYTKYRMHLFLNEREKSNRTTTILKWNESDIDIFEAELDRGYNHTYYTKLWVNGTKVFDVSESKYEDHVQIFTLQK